MRLSIESTRWIARWVLGILLLAQGIYVAQACVDDFARPTMAFGAKPCAMNHDEQAPLPNACLSQCLQADQTAGGALADVPAPANPPALILPTAFVATPFIAGALSSRCISDSGPPLLIKHCSLRL